MYLINKDTNRMEKLEATTFKLAGFKERQHLQEWIAKNPESLGEDLLIIQKEFAGFDDTNERLDLLALDKKGNLVVIENKLDDTGKEVVWQSLKYASYCSSLTSQEIKRIFNEYLLKQGKGETAQKALDDFFDNEDFEEKLNTGYSQRIIMVAGEFRKEVTSTALWLLNYGLKIQCFKATAYKLEDSILLDFDQIIPVKEAEDYMIKIASKNREEINNQQELKTRHTARFEFWTEFLKEVNKKNNICANLSPSKDAWIGVGAGISGININLVISRSYARVEVYINRGGITKNKEMFDYFLQNKSQIEQTFGAPLIWERMEDRVSSRIKWQLDGVSVFEETDWEEMIKFMIDGLERMKKAFSEPIKNF